MVDTSFDDAGRERAARWFKVGFVLLVGASGGLVAAQAGAGATQIAVAVGAALVLGAVLTWFVVRNLRQVQPEGIDERRRRRRNR